jgi:histidinol-phosphate/aromatic aminotransferase/cobyric acid decarboxylase-like protein
VRHFNPPEIADFVRITIGTDPQMDRLLAAVARLWP